jgi:hypothetical protein
MGALGQRAKDLVSIPGLGKLASFLWALISSFIKGTPSEIMKVLFWYYRTF